MVRFLDALAQKLAASVKPALSALQQASLRQELERLDRALVQQLKSNPFQFNRKEFWNGLVEHPEFSLSLIASQRLAYAAVYFGYEDFLLKCFKQVSGVTEYRIGRNVVVDLSRKFTPGIATEIWSHREVAIPRLVRHAIAHNGARETTSLAKMNHSIGVLDGALQITPTQTRLCFNQLKVRAKLLLQESLKRIPLTVQA